MGEGGFGYLPDHLEARVVLDRLRQRRSTFRSNVVVIKTAGTNKVTKRAFDGTREEREMMKQKMSTTTAH